MSLLAVTVLGRDRPGIVADSTAALARLGGNLEDSTMTLLRGHFAMLLLVRTDAAPDDVRSALDPLTVDGRLDVTVDGEPAPSLRFMGGREFDLISDGWDRPIGQAAVERVMARGVFALPSWTAGGPFPETEGRIVGGDVDGEERAAVAALYVVMMTDLSLDLIRSDNMLVVDGGLAKIDLFTAMLAQLRPAQAVVRSSMSEGSATGAAALAFKSLGLSPFEDETTPVSASRIEGLEAYRDRWRELAEHDRAAVRARVSDARRAGA